MRRHPPPRQATASTPRPRAAYADAGVEPPLEELMTEPIVGALMTRDGVRPDALRALLAAARRGLVARDPDGTP